MASGRKSDRQPPASPPSKKAKKGATPAAAKDGASKLVAATPAPRQWHRTGGENENAMTFLYWNVGGIKSAIKNRSELMKKLAQFDGIEPEVICIAEHKVQAQEVPAMEKELLKVLPNYRPIWACSSTRKGYSGVVALLKQDIVQPIGLHAVTNAAVKVKSPEKTLDRYEIASCHRGVGIPPTKEEYNLEGRVITINFKRPNLYLVFAYVPNSGDGLKRIRYRIDKWEADMRDYLKKLAKEKAVCYVGDLNVAHLDSDIWNVGAKHLEKSAGTTPEERNTFSKLLNEGFVDGFRHFHPEAEGNFTYWSVRARNRPHNRGLRLDYTIASEGMLDASSDVQMADAFILDDICAGHGDHCGVGVTVKY